MSQLACRSGQPVQGSQGCLKIASSADRFLERQGAMRELYAFLVIHALSLLTSGAVRLENQDEHGISYRSSRLPETVCLQCSPRVVLLVRTYLHLQSRCRWVYANPRFVHMETVQSEAPKSALDYTHMGMLAVLPDGQLAAAWQVKQLPARRFEETVLFCKD